MDKINRTAKQDALCIVPTYYVATHVKILLLQKGKCISRFHDKRL